MAKVELKEIVDALDIACEGMKTYLDKSTGEVFRLAEEHLDLAEEGDFDPEDRPKWEHELIEQAIAVVQGPEGRFVELPSKFNIHDWDIMERLSHKAVDDNDIADDLETAIHGSGAFRNFRDAIRRHGIEKEWYKYREGALREIAINWCKDNDIEFSDTQG